MGARIAQAITKRIVHGLSVMRIPEGNNVADAHNVTVILRLVLNGRGELTHGEIVDMEGKPWGQFMRWAGLTRSLRAWLDGQKSDHPMKGP